MTPEKQITNAIIRILKRTPNLWYVKLHGGPMQQAGLPDLCLVVNGMSVWIEVKAPGGTVSPLQERTMGQIRDAGGLTFVVRSSGEVEQILSELFPAASEGGGA